MDRIGLIDAVLHAGAGSVLASLLPIDDLSTVEFMKAATGTSSPKKPEALAEVQRAMLRGELPYTENGHLRSLTHPRYWAPFILFGD